TENRVWLALCAGQSGRNSTLMGVTDNQNTNSGARSNPGRTGAAASNRVLGETFDPERCQTVALPTPPSAITATSRPPSLSWLNNVSGTSGTAPLRRIAS